MTGRLLADRVMKARRESTCPSCRGPIRVGQLIARCGVWMHAACLIEHQRDHDRVRNEMSDIEPADLAAHRAVSDIQIALADDDRPAAAVIIDALDPAEAKHCLIIMAQCWLDIAAGLLPLAQLRQALRRDAQRQAELGEPDGST